MTKRCSVVPLFPHENDSSAQNRCPKIEALISSAKHHLTTGPFGRIRARGAIAPWPEQGPSSTNNSEMDVISLLDHVLLHCGKYSSRDSELRKHLQLSYTAEKRVSSETMAIEAGLSRKTALVKAATLYRY
jgi:hypothetical protein